MSDCMIGVVGGGNAAHVVACDLTLKGYKVNVYAPFQDEAARMNKGIAVAGGIRINYKSKGTSAMAKPNLVSKCPKEAIPGCKYIYIPLPAFAQEASLMQIVPHCDDDACVIAMPGTGCLDWTADKVFKKLGKRITVAGMAPLPYVCRIEKYGEEVNLYGIKEEVGMATAPGSAIDKIAPAVEKTIGLTVKRYPTFLPVTLTPTNPIMHTARLYGMFVGNGYWRDLKGFPEMIKFYDDTDDTSNEWLEKLDAENQAICKAVEKQIPGAVRDQVLPLNKYLKWVYGADIDKWDTPADCFRSNKQFHGIGSPMLKVAPGYYVPDFSSRYFTEDFPYGLLTNRGLAELFGVPTPTMDTIILWAQKEMDKKWLVDGKINTEEQPQMTPQSFGLDLKAVTAMYSDHSRM